MESSHHASEFSTNMEFYTGSYNQSEKAFHDRVIAAQCGEVLEHYMFKDHEIRSYFPEGISFILENDDRAQMKAKISEITDFDNLVAFYIDANETQLNSIIIGNRVIPNFNHKSHFSIPKFCLPKKNGYLS